MHRKLILGLIESYVLRYPQEAETAARITSFVEENAACFSRDLLIGHITGSAWLLDTSGRRVLLTHHKKLNIWVQLGGHADGDPDIQAVALKEAGEESGLSDIRFRDDGIFDIDIHSIPARGAVPRHLHYDCRFLLQAEDDEFSISDESHDLRWVVMTEIATLTTEESILRMARKSSLNSAGLSLKQDPVQGS